jgi:hypothetical protein
MVERSDLAALEFLMSKQPRGRVRVSEGNTVGARVPNVFAEVDKFQKRFREMEQKSATREFQVMQLTHLSNSQFTPQRRSRCKRPNASPSRRSQTPSGNQRCTPSGP